MMIEVRKGYPDTPCAPLNLPLTILGTGILVRLGRVQRRVALAADGIAAQAIMNTFAASMMRIGCVDSE